MPKSISAEWTPEREAQLRRLWGEGTPAAEIGRIMKIPPNAVTGKAHRLKLSARSSPIRPPVAQPLAPRASPVLPGQRTLPLMPSEMAAAAARAE